MTLVLAVEIDGVGVDPAVLRRTAEIAERAGFNLVTLEDDLVTPGRIGGVERAAFIAAATSVLGVAPVVATTYTEPFHISSQLASLDHVSAGRAGWIVAASPDPAVAAAWGRPVADLAQEALDSVRVVRELWDSWEDDAVVRDVATGRYLDQDRLHYIDDTAATYSVKGPAIVPRPPQGQLVVLAPRGLLAGDVDVDVTLIGGVNVDEIQALASTLSTPRTFVNIDVALDTAAADGADRAATSIAERTAHPAWGSRGHLRYTGSSEGFVALLRELDARGGVDGVRLHPLALDDDLAVLSQYTLPGLHRARIVNRTLPGTTLRQTLGLPRPVNRYATAGGAA
ncbi:LLM class flavin-dependent oxidoreductase [Dactylosporangium sp. NPDC051541]|uniref:LLM class flavin-dependent oxidoreductase n=1 Tax=Dactylosporangium sp. NPDC051541 TaxID=3363977 RepID=UPI00378B8C2E